MKKTFLVDKEYSNSRLDRWFKKNVCQIPQSLLEKNIRKGNIKINNKKHKSSYKLKLNDKIFIKDFNPTPTLKKQSLDVYKPTQKEVKSSSDFVIYNDENFLVINKPAGISVQSGTKSKRNLLDILKNSEFFKDSKPYTVHRIDKETSGILIVAKNRKYAQLFTSLFRIRKIHKTYVGIVLGKFKDNKGIFKDELFYYEGKKKNKAIKRDKTAVPAKIRIQTGLCFFASSSSLTARRSFLVEWGSLSTETRCKAFSTWMDAIPRWEETSKSEVWSCTSASASAGTPCISQASRNAR